jgi:hypothetical protein
MVLLAAFLLMNASVALAEYPATFSTNLLNGVVASTTVNLYSGMQVAQITFEGPAGEFGSVFLSPVQPYAQNMRFIAGKQELMISKISFYAAFGLTMGKVILDGSMTDANGDNTQSFNGVIAQWND